MYDSMEHYKVRGPVTEFGDAIETPSVIKNVGWTLGNYCPHKCKHCYSMSARKPGFVLIKLLIFGGQVYSINVTRIQKRRGQHDKRYQLFCIYYSGARRAHCGVEIW